MFFALRFRIFIVTLSFLRISSPRRFHFFFPSSFSFSFPFFPHFSFVHFFFSYFPSPQFAPFPQFSLPFPTSGAPVLPHFLLPWYQYTYQWRKKHIYTKVPKLLFTPVSAQGGSTWIQPVEISVRNLHHICIHLKKL